MVVRTIGRDQNRSGRSSAMPARPMRPVVFGAIPKPLLVLDHVDGAKSVRPSFGDATYRGRVEEAARFEPDEILAACGLYPLAQSRCSSRI